MDTSSSFYAAPPELRWLRCGFSINMSRLTALPHFEHHLFNSATSIQNTRIKTPVIISASIQTKSMLNHARRSIATPSFS